MMGRIATILSVGSIVGSLAVLTTPVLATSQDTWVSGTGNDANTASFCARTTPCQNFSAALGVTTGGGVIHCVDPDISFGLLSIAIDVTIDCSGTYGALFGGSSSSGINISAAGATVTLRGLTLYSIPVVGATGITITAAGAVVRVEQCEIFGFQTGIQFAPNAAGSYLTVVDSIIKDNNGANGGGILIQPQGGGDARVDLDGVRVLNNTGGVFADAAAGTSVQLAMRNSQVSGNADFGFYGRSDGGYVTALIDNSSIANTAAYAASVGVYSVGTLAYVFVGRSTITANSTGWAFGGGGNLVSYMNNNVALNTTNGSPSGTTGRQ
jgi:hypothetical protein